MFESHTSVMRDGKIRLPPRTGCLGVTEERFNLPNDVLMLYYNKSTFARLFLEASATLAEPGWIGHLTLEIYNASDVGVHLEVGQPIGQVVFTYLTEPTDAPYSGKYQNQGKVPTQALYEKEQAWPLDPNL